MENTIMPGDDVIGFRLAYKFSDPKRGDIVIFWPPTDSKDPYIKRIIGLPGEKVTIEPEEKRGRWSYDTGRKSIYRRRGIG